MDKMIKIERYCPACGEKHHVYVPATAYYKWLQTDLYIQDVFTMLNATEREQLLSGLCPQCQALVFNE